MVILLKIITSFSKIRFEEKIDKIRNDFMVMTTTYKVVLEQDNRITYLAFIEYKLK